MRRAHSFSGRLRPREQHPPPACAVWLCCVDRWRARRVGAMRSVRARPSRHDECISCPHTKIAGLTACMRADISSSAGRPSTARRERRQDGQGRLFVRRQASGLLASSSTRSSWAFLLRGTPDARPSIAPNLEPRPLGWPPQQFLPCFQRSSPAHSSPS